MTAEPATHENPYAVPCPECGLVFACEFFMLNHQISHYPQPHAFIDLAIERLA
jgi:hypothetical protein